jgi:threonine dehydratase
VTDAELCDAMRFAFERLKLVIEPSGAAALAAALTERVPIRGKRVGITISGGNVDPATFARLIA